MEVYVYNHAVINHKMRSYDRRHVDKREARAKIRYMMRLNEKYQQLQVSYHELKKECNNNKHKSSALKHN